MTYHPQLPALPQGHPTRVHCPKCRSAEFLTGDNETFYCEACDHTQYGAATMSQYLAARGWKEQPSWLARWVKPGRPGFPQDTAYAQNLQEAFNYELRREYEAAGRESGY